MKTETYQDKSSWSEGPWKTEPDKAHWVDPETGFDCLIVRNGGGALCGYVGVPPGHPAFEKGYDEVQSRWDNEGNEKAPLFEIEVHGGLTYADHSDEDGKICHKAEGEDKVWWLGFDCAHSGDMSPKYRHEWPSHLAGYETYKDFQYVKSEVERLALQLRIR